FLKEISLKYIELNNKVIPEDEVLKFFNENKKNFSLGEMRKGQFSLIPNKNKKNDDYYKLISSIENDIIKNTNFNEINKKYNLISKSTEFVNKNSLNINFRESGDKRINETLFKLSLEVSNELVQVDDQYFLVHLDEIKNNLIPSLNNTIPKTNKNEISIKKNLEEAKNIVEKNPSNFNALQNYALNNKNNIKNLKISRSKMSSNKFSKSNLDLIYKAKENQNLYLIDEEKVYLVYVEKISEIKNYDKNLEEIFNASVISQFDKLIIYDFENYINKQFKIKFNQKTIDRLKSNI
ncbi:MAG: peptidylprolyl isomerase, partial [Burkholderiaceae bacterium]